MACKTMLLANHKVQWMGQIKVLSLTTYHRWNKFLPGTSSLSTYYRWKRFETEYKVSVILTDRRLYQQHCRFKIGSSNGWTQKQEEFAISVVSSRLPIKQSANLTSTPSRLCAWFAGIAYSAGATIHIGSNNILSFNNLWSCK